MGPYLRGPPRASIKALHCVSSAGPVSTYLEDQQARPAKEGGAPSGLTVRVPAHCAVGRGGERIIAGLLVLHLTFVRPDLADNQFSFHQWLSTIDDIMGVKSQVYDFPQGSVLGPHGPPRYPCRQDSAS